MQNYQLHRKDGCPVWLRLSTVTSQPLKRELSHGCQSPPPHPYQTPPPPHLESGQAPVLTLLTVERNRKGRMKRWMNTLRKRKKTTTLKQAESRFKHQKECLEKAPKQLLLTAENVSAALCYWLVNSTDAFKFHIKYWLKPSPNKWVWGKYLSKLRKPQEAASKRER